MKKLFKFIILLLTWGAVIPAAAGFGITCLWNLLLPSMAGVASITFIQGVGLFFLGQLLSAGFIVGLFMLGGIIHACGIGGHHHHMRHTHWHDMTDEQRRDFLNRRRQWFEQMHSTPTAPADGE